MKHLQRMKPRCVRPKPSGMYETLTAYETPTCMIPRRVRCFISHFCTNILPFYEHWGAYVPKPSGMYETLTAYETSLRTS